MKLKMQPVDYKKIIKDRELRLRLIRLLSFVPSKPYLKLVYRIKTGKKLNLNNPKGFNEKLNWLKLNDIHEEYTELVDKVRVRKYIEDKIGGEFLFPLLGTWSSFDEINFEALPKQFVLKCNHDSGSVKVIRDKSKIDKTELKKFFNGRLKINPYCIGREYPYKKVKACILAEKLMVSEKGGGINDYKFFCFNGRPEIMFVATDRETDVKFDFFDMNFNHLDIVNIHENAKRKVEKPAAFDQMVAIAEKLSQGIPCVRIDLYDIDGKVYFGEFTFFHGGGFYLFKPDEWEMKLGDMIDIAKK